VRAAAASAGSGGGGGGGKGCEQTYLIRAVDECGAATAAVDCARKMRCAVHKAAGGGYISSSSDSDGDDVAVRDRVLAIRQH
jgi:hypothetical protein